MAPKAKRTQISETPSERFDRVVKQVTDRQRRAKMRKKNQPRSKSANAAR